MCYVKMDQKKIKNILDEREFVDDKLKACFKKERLLAILQKSSVSDSDFDCVLESLKQYSFKIDRFLDETILELLELDKLQLLDVINMSIASADIIMDHAEIFNYLSLAETISIDDIAYLCLMEDKIKALCLVNPSKITKEEILSVDSYELYEVLCDERVQQGLRFDYFNFSQVKESVELGDLDEFLENFPFITNMQLNTNQSTHTTSVHESASKSARRIYDLYHSQLNKVSISAIEKKLLQLDDLPKRQAAIRLLSLIQEGIFHQDTIDPATNITLITLIKLCYLAISDSTLRIASEKAGLEALENALYEIIRGYNLDENGIDDQKTDKPICFGGAFNKLIEKFVGIHPFFEQIYVNFAALSLYLPKAVQESLIEYLSNRYENLKGLKSEIEQLNQTIDMMNQNAQVNDEIWQNIKSIVLDKIFERYGQLFENKHDHKLLDFIEFGKNLTVLIDIFEDSKSVDHSSSENMLFLQQDEKKSITQSENLHFD